MFVRTPIRCLAFGACVFLLLDASRAAALDPTLALTQYVQTVWRMEEGLPHNSVRAVLQTRDGYIWLGTYGGLVRFDGVRFKVFDNKNSGLRDNEIRALAEDASGVLWIGTTAGGLHLLVGERLEPFDAGIEHRTINALEAGPDGRLWIGSSGGLYVLQDGVATLFAKESGLANPFVNALSLRGKQVWIGTPTGLFRFSDGRIQTAPYPGGPNPTVWSVLEDDEGRVWVGQQNRVVELHWDADRNAVSVTRRFDLPDVWGWVARFLKDKDRNLWIGTYGGGLYRLAGDRVDRISAGAGLLDHRPWALWEDREGSLWVGTRGGLARLRDGPAVTFSAREGLADDIVRSVMEDRDGTIWIGTANGASRYRDGKITNYGLRDGLPASVVRGFLRDRRGRLWVATERGIAPVTSDRGTFGRMIEIPGGRPFAVARPVLEDSKGRVWLGSDRGLTMAPRGLGVSRPESVPGLEDIELQNIEALFEDREGGIWIGTLSAGLRRWFEGRVESPTLLGGASIGVRSFHEDQDGTLYVGTLGSGLFVRERGEPFRRITTRDGLTDDAIWSILQTDADTLWMSSDRGVFRVSRAGLLDFVAGRAGTVVVDRVVGTEDGMKSRECNGGGTNPGLIARDGRLWYPTSVGAVVIDPRKLRDQLGAPPVVIEEVVIDRSLQAQGSDIVAPAGSRDIEVHYTGLSFANSNRLSFRYRVEGYDTAWVDAGPRRVAYLSGLPAGTYTFRVQAQNGAGAWNETGASIRLRVEPRLVETLAFRGGAVLFFLGLGAGWLRLRTRQLRLREEELERLVATRTDELERANRQLAELATVDDLTGIANHRRFVDFLDLEWARCLRGREPISLLLCDVDDFKTYNDTYGHQAGDSCLREVAGAIAGVVHRETDLAARYGGEEFAVILPLTDRAGALAVAESIRLAVESLEIAHRASRAGRHVTVSIGCATTWPAQNEAGKSEDLIAAADRALYEAKSQGRNRTVAASGVAGEA